MSRLSFTFSKPKHKALIPYVAVGYPTLEATLKVVPLLAQNGADIVELGIPFSDPLADGATIQNASFRALQNGVTPKRCLEVAAELRRRVDIPLIFMTYYNPVLNYGLDEFCLSSKNAGIDGLIIPDLPPEEGSALEIVAQNQGLDLIYLLAPTSTEARIRLVAGKSHGFIYLVSITGTTGARDKLPQNLEDFVLRVREMATQPLCVGFGIASAEQAKRVAQIADGVIVGSLLIQLMESDDSLASAIHFISGLRQALNELA